jgi:hypothetical protein
MPAVVTRLRAECALFEERVASSSRLERVSDQTELAVPHAFFVLDSVEPMEDVEISAVSSVLPGESGTTDTMLRIGFQIIIAVDNSSDDRGESGTNALAIATASIAHALINWTPDDAEYSPIMFDGMERLGELSNRARLWGVLAFHTETRTSLL